MELVLLGTGGCTAFDVLDILKKGRQAVEDCWVELEAERAPEPPKVFTRITMRFVVTGKGLSRTTVERAVQLSAEKYCSASIMLGKTAEIVREVEIRDADRRLIGLLRRASPRRAPRPNHTPTLGGRRCPSRAGWHRCPAPG